MASLIKRCQKQTLVYWPPVGFEPTGEPIWGPPEEMACRWDDSLREIITGTGTRVASSISVISASRLLVGGLIRLGTIATTAHWDDPKLNGDVYEILRSDATPNLKNRETLYEAYA